MVIFPMSGVLVFRGLKSEPDAEIEQKGTFFKDYGVCRL